MDLNLATFEPVLKALASAGLPVLEQSLTAVLSGATGPFGLLVSPALNLIWPAINGALGLAPDTPPDQTAAAINADPDAARDKLAAVQEDHSYALASTKQDQDFALAADKQAGDRAVESHAQQVAINTVEAQNPSLFIGGWRPALAWSLGAIVLMSFVLPYCVWLALAFGGHLPPPPTLDPQATYILAGLLGITIAARSVDKATGTAAPSIGGTAKIVTTKRTK